jgi:dephospho-CoA kinase
MQKICVISGHNGVGKDTFVNFIKDNCPFHTIINVSTIDCVKAAARKLGWDGIKDEKGRLFLSELKYFANQYYPISLNTVYEAIDENPRASCIFVHCREPKEIDKIKEEFDAITVLVKNDNIAAAKNFSDQHVEDYKYDYIIDNNGSLYDLERTAKEFITRVLL